jgi:hypothetical protein
LARVFGGKRVRAEGVFMGALAWMRGKKSYRIGEESAEIFQELAVFVSNSMGGMTGGVAPSATEERGGR